MAPRLCNRCDEQDERILASQSTEKRGKQSPYTDGKKMRVFLDLKAVTYESAEQAAKDLQAKGHQIQRTLGDTVQLSSHWEKGKGQPAQSWR